jgi:hypothetical protein
MSRDYEVYDGPKYQARGTGAFCDAHWGRADSGWPARHADVRFLPSNPFGG